MKEWGDGTMVEESGSVTPQGSGAFSATTGAGDYSSSAGGTRVPAKFLAK
jgi:hypothetical protein